MTYIFPSARKNTSGINANNLTYQKPGDSNNQVVIFV